MTLVVLLVALLTVTGLRYRLWQVTGICDEMRRTQVEREGVLQQVLGGLGTAADGLRAVLPHLPEEMRPDAGTAIQQLVAAIDELTLMMRPEDRDDPAA